MDVYTIGFTQRTAASFFGALRAASIGRLVDVRLSNSSQLAGFAKRDDLAFFLRELCGAEYIHEPLLAPTQEILDSVKKRRGSWEVYDRDFLALMSERKIEERLSPELFATPTVVLCSEPTATHCHRRLVLDYLQGKWGNLHPIHL